MKFRTQGKIALALAIVAIAAVLIGALIVFAPEAEERQREQALTTVEVIEAQRGTATVEITAQGVVAAPRETQVAAEVGGAITHAAENFEVGGEFAAGDIMVEIDPADYASLLAQAEANVADAKLNLALEQGRARQAERDWKSVGDAEPPSELVLRLPQLRSAEAKLTSAEAAAAKARRDLERAKVRAPYGCKIRMTYTEFGSVLAPGSPVADVYEVGGYEVRLPVALDDYEFIEGDGVGAQVEFAADVAGADHHWTGTVVRNEGLVDRASRSVYLVARIESTGAGKFLRPGLFVRARIEGRQLDAVIDLPRKALYGADRVYVIGDEQRLHFRDVEIVRTEADRVLVSSGLEAGERVCVTNLAAAIDNMKVRVLDQQAAPEPPPAQAAERDGGGAAPAASGGEPGSGQQQPPAPAPAGRG